MYLSEFAQRFCTSDGEWEGRSSSDEITENDTEATFGWTNYTGCFIPEIRNLMNKLYSKSEKDGQVSFLKAYSKQKCNKHQVEKVLHSIYWVMRVYSIEKLSKKMPKYTELF